MSIAAAMKVWADPEGDTFRLIHQGTLGVEASIAGFAERYSRGRTSHTLHVWWARRPHSAMRSLIFETACRNLSQANSEIAAKLAAGVEDGLKDAQAVLSADYQGQDGPAILDMFGGGGTIPFEAALLGARSHSIDYNALSVFIQTSNLVMSQLALRTHTSGELASIAERAGNALLEAVKARTDDLFDRSRGANGSVTFAYFWTYQHVCGSCGYEYLLSRRPWLAKRSGKSVSISIKPTRTGDDVVLSESADPAKVTRWASKGAGAACPKCSAAEKPSITALRDVSVAKGILNKKGGKTYSVGLAPALDDSALQTRIDGLLSELDTELPSTALPKWSGIVNPAIYGMNTHADMFNKRQTAVYLELCKALREQHADLRALYSNEVANYITSALSSLLDQFIDWNCRLSMWISQNEQVGRAFCGPGVSMLWDYVETDCLENGPANLWSKLSRIIGAIESTPKFDHLPSVSKGRAQELPFESASFDAIVTDPPYYDNMFYNILSDFFYAWKRLALAPIFPDSFAATRTDEDDELVASSIRQGSSDAAHDWYCEALGRALSEAARVLTDDGVLSFVYSHSSLRGWLAIVSAFRSSGLHIDTVEPLSIERRQRPRAMTSEAINTCVVLVARKQLSAPAPANLADIRARVVTDLETYGLPLENAGWASEDIGLALFSRAASYLANAKAVIGHDDELVLDGLSGIIKERYQSFKLQKRKSL
ncbi:putative DNA methylase [Endobacter medicaginis]|uniref:DUF1156 domain-containing protein n=1 Tax=Endobacter medicaginis TaxID=1181271 RepID=A0A839V0K5_9PROT|nr:DUF1156 domain-containing protein [Endobacter medicaginis]MBB3175536.1 putative DNA methylase [Endobacter medicaginis]MCX5477127.1 DUF1156 domain-containing protein [Endobacter medicaginis]NVN30422.1 DUF1156 domain-containing protein [Endobacter medicaginis]